jgi:hypothetical protein
MMEALKAKLPRRWIPQVNACGWSSSDGYDDDADGWSIELEWLGVIVQFNIGRRLSVEEWRKRLND